MWSLAYSRRSGKPYLWRVGGDGKNETQWPQTTPVSRAYDSVVGNTHDETPESQRMRRDNNAWKQNLLEVAVPPNATVLDLCGGKGGDLLKFWHIGVKHCHVVDCSPASIAEARRRAVPIEGMDVVADACDLRTTRVPRPAWLGKKKPHVYDAISCMFALHYFAESEATMRRLVQQVARHLKKKGRFVTTFPCHEAVCAALETSASLPSHMRVFGTVPDDLQTEPWGHAYTFEFVGRTPPLEEFVVYQPALEQLCNEAGLTLERRIDGPSKFYTGLVFTKA